LNDIKIFEFLYLSKLSLEIYKFENFDGNNSKINYDY